MIRPFLLIAIVVHTIALTWVFDYSIPKFVIPGPELSIALVQSTAQSQSTSPSPRYSTNSIIGDLLQGNRSENRDTPPAPAPRFGRQQSAASNPAEASHLKALLRSAIQEHFVYPPIARKNGWQGRVYIGLTISSVGKFRDIRLVKRSSYPVLDSSAVDTLKRIGAVPTMQAFLPDHGQDLVIPVNYRLIEEI